MPGTELEYATVDGAVMADPAAALLPLLALLVFTLLRTRFLGGD